MKTPALAGFAPLPTIARHWRVTPETARLILPLFSVRVMRRGGRAHVSWLDIWRIEGLLDPDPALFEELRLPLLTRDDVADRYGVSKRTARRWMSSGEVPTIRLSPRILRVREGDLDRSDAACLGEDVMA